jgi:hypothetical protein
MRDLFEKGFALRLGQVIAENRQPCLLCPPFMAIDG